MSGAIPPRSPEKALRRELSFTTGCVCELLLVVLALAWSWLFHRPALSDIHWSLNGVAVGVAAAIPPFAFFIWTLNSSLRLWSHHRHLLESLLRPLFGNWSLLQLFTLSLIAGISEEAFFRGAVQGSLADRVNVILAVVVASGLFGACHLLTWTYAIIAAFIGAYLGLLWIWTGNLLTPMITHAVYDFAALVYFLRFRRSG
jgi:membrane protease YdiL (CAAX protease family)